MTHEKRTLEEHMTDLTTRELQQAIMAHKRRRGFNTTDMPLEICLLQKEIGEFFDAWRTQDGQGAELADIGIYLLSLAEMVGVDLGVEITRKMAVNSRRRYEELPNGAMVRVSEGVT